MTNLGSDVSKAASDAKTGVLAWLNANKVALIAGFVVGVVLGFFAGRI